VAGVPKTIDNDIAIIDRSFGFRTAIEEACKTVKGALVEARSAENGIAVVKLMGRDSGFIATHTVLADTDVDLCLIPEVPFTFDGADGVLKHLRRVVAGQGHAVVVLAEGAGQNMLEGETEVDKSGNVMKKVAPQIPSSFHKRIFSFAVQTDRLLCVCVCVCVFVCVLGASFVGLCEPLNRKDQSRFQGKRHDAHLEIHGPFISNPECSGQRR